MARSHGKPVMIAEASPQGYHLSRGSYANIGAVVDGPTAEDVRHLSGENIWQEWYVPFFDYIRDNSDVIGAVAYINTDWDSQDLWDAPYEQGYWGDSRVHANPIVQAQWLQEISRPNWLHGPITNNQ